MPPSQQIATIAAREILTRLHDVMASRSNAQSKLDQVVQIISTALLSDVCSIYLLRDGVLELFATYGLKQEAVHVTRLSLGQGLVGTIARDMAILNLSEATSHPDFVHNPETGEEFFHSFAGVPIVRREQAVGVLAVQSAESRRFADIEVEALQTVAMVLAELIFSAGLIDENSLASSGSKDQGFLRYNGLKLVEGMGRGYAVFHQPRVTIEFTVAEDVEVERQRLNAAFARMREQIEHMAQEAEFFGNSNDHREVLATYRMFAYDEGWRRRIDEAIDSGLTAEAAIERVQQHNRMRMREIGDPILADRLHDLEDLSNRLLRLVSGQLGTAARLGLHDDAILIARNMGPAELLEYDRRRLKGIVLEEGSLTSHVTIVAKAIGIPVLGRVKEIHQGVREGDLLLVDSNQGAVFIRPTPEIEEAFATRFALSRKRRAEFAAMRDLPAITRDNHRIELMINAGLRDDVAALEATGADGIGLFRTEFEFLVSSTLPRRERQLRLYRDILEAAGDRPVIFRTVDIGNDKTLPYINNSDETVEENPALGWRAIRLALEKKALLKVQARALIEGAAGKTLYVMFPMIAEPWEYEQARAVFEKQNAWLAKHDKPRAKRIYYGSMLEVPSLAETLDILLPKLDFLSIGTNDLIQFFFAADRAYPKLAERYDWLSPALLRFLSRIIDQANAAGCKVGICGEMGGRTLTAMALIGLGLKRLSITPVAIGPIKAMIRSLDRDAFAPFIRELVASGASNIGDQLEAWAKKHGVVIN